MTYCVQQDLIDRFGPSEILELSDRSNTGAIDATVVTRALTDADALVNSYISTKVTLPLVTVPTTLVRIAADVARYYLSDDRPTQAVKDNYAAAVKFLKDVAAGVATLGVDSSNQPPPISGGPQVRAGDRIFTVGNTRTGTAGTLDDY